MDNFMSDTSASSTPPVSPEPGVLDAALDAMFGKEGVEDTKSGSTSGSSEDKFTMPDSTGETDWQKLARNFQSEKDRTAAELQKITAQVQSQYQPVVEFFNQIYEDKDVRQAFIAELEPELIKPKDPHTFIKERLAKEFGEGYDPDAEDDKLKVRMYNIRAEQLLKEAFENKDKAIPKTLKELKAERKRQAEVRDQEALREKQAILSQMQWDENKYTEWMNWAQKIKPVDIAKLYDRMAKQANKNSQFSIPSLANVPGGSPVMPNQYKQELDRFFGEN